MKYDNFGKVRLGLKKLDTMSSVWIWVIVALVATMVMAGCVEKKMGQVDGNGGEERMFVEGHLRITNAVAVNNYIREYGLQTGKEYYIQYTASKYMGNVDSEMYMNVILPDGIQKIAGDIEWIGKDKTKTIEIKIRPIKEGNYQIKAVAKNLGNNFSTVNIIKIHVGDTIEEAKNLTVYNTTVVLPLETISGEVNTKQISANSSPVKSGEYIPPKYRGPPNPTNGDQGPINPITGKKIKPGDKFEFNESTLRYENTLIPLEKPVVDAAPALLGVKVLAQVPSNYTNVRGIAVTYGFKNESNKSYMLRGIQVELWEPHWYGDSKLATVYTVEATNDGEYGLSKSNYVNSSGGWNHVDNSGYFDFGNVYVGSDGKDVYLRVVFIGHDGGDGNTSGGTEKLVIHDETVLFGWDIPYYQTFTFHISSGEDTGILLVRVPDLGTEGLNDEAAHVYYDIWKTYGYFREANQYVHGKADAYINLPANTSNDAPYTEGSNGYKIHYTGWDNNYLTYEYTSSIIHEYSHSIMWGMYGNSFPPLAPGDTNHGGCANTNSADALIEGWGRFVPPVAQKDNFYRWGSLDTPLNIDTDEVTFSTCDDKEEWVFGGIIYDLRKDIGTPNTWMKYISDSFNEHDPALVRTFYDNFTSDHGYVCEVWPTFNRHGVNYNTSLLANSWQNCRDLYVKGTSAGAQTNYQMKLTVYNSSGTDTPGVVYLGGKSRSDFGDLRFTKSDGVTLLDYWIESYTSGVSATVWVEVDSIPASPNTATIYLYYGNPRPQAQATGLRHLKDMEISVQTKDLHG